MSARYEIAGATQIYLARQVKLTLYQRRMTQRKLAAQADVHEVYLSRVLRGQVRGSPELWDRILTTLDM